MRSVRPGSALSFDGVASFDRDPHMASSSWSSDLTSFPSYQLPGAALPEGWWACYRPGL